MLVIQIVSVIPITRSAKIVSGLIQSTVIEIVSIQPSGCSKITSWNPAANSKLVPPPTITSMIGSTVRLLVNKWRMLKPP